MRCTPLRQQRRRPNQPGRSRPALAAHGSRCRMPYRPVRVPLPQAFLSLWWRTRCGRGPNRRKARRSAYWNSSIRRKKASRHQRSRHPFSFAMRHLSLRPSGEWGKLQGHHRRPPSVRPFLRHQRPPRTEQQPSCRRLRCSKIVRRQPVRRQCPSLTSSATQATKVHGGKNAGLVSPLSAISVARWRNQLFTNLCCCFSQS